MTTNKDMRDDRFTHVAFVVVLFTVTGTGVGILGWLVALWGETAFVANAAGDTGQIGPAFVALLYLVLSAVTVLIAPGLAVVFGLLFGSRVRTPGDGVLVGALGGGIGTLFMTVIANGLFLLTQGAAASQAHGFVGVLWLIASVTVVSALVGAAGGAIGSEMG